jgi:uncharacterized protein involved in tellurium resistance
MELSTPRRATKSVACETPQKEAQCFAKHSPDENYCASWWDFPLSCAEARLRVTTAELEMSLLEARAEARRWQREARAVAYDFERSQAENYKLQEECNNLHLMLDALHTEHVKLQQLYESQIEGRIVVHHAWLQHCRAPLLAKPQHFDMGNDIDDVADDADDDDDDDDDCSEELYGASVSWYDQEELSGPSCCQGSAAEQCRGALKSLPPVGARVEVTVAVSPELTVTELVTKVSSATTTEACPHNLTPRAGTSTVQLSSAPLIPPRMFAAVEQLSPVKLKVLQEKNKQKHAVLEEISRAMQTKRTWSKLINLGVITGTECNNERAVKINMALRSAQNAEVLTLLGVERRRHGAAWDEALEELRSIAEVDTGSLTKQALDVFCHYTKEGYENITGNARGGSKLDAVSKQMRPMTSEEEADGVKNLQLLKQHWHSMPCFRGTEVFRVVHAGTAEAALQVGQSIIKKNPTSTSVALDWSRVDDEKRICKITIVGNGNGPVDIRAVSTYTHEAEILLPPDTQFTLEQNDCRYLHITARVPS